MLHRMKEVVSEEAAATAWRGSREHRGAHRPAYCLLHQHSCLLSLLLCRS